MKNNKGFTLVELLAIVAILMLIMAIITPKVFKQLKTAENVTDQEQINALINTAKLYMNQNSNLLPQENDLYVISLDELKESGLIQKNQILKPSTNEELTGCVVVNYEKNKYKYEYKEKNCDKLVVVTFYPNGGTVDKTSKIVATTETYEELPTPTREGYTFMGWNGKNMFDMTSWLNSFSTVTHGKLSKDDKSITITATSADAYTDSWGTFQQKAFKINVIPHTSYTFSWNSDSNKSGVQYAFFNGQSTSDNMFNANNSRIKNFSFMTKSDTQYINIRLGVSKLGDSITYSNIQIEEGDNATPYEPYYITSDTTVVQQKNHTLKAIWKANE